MSDMFKNFIAGVDISPEVCLTEGYVSAWYHPKEKDILYIYSQKTEEGFQYSAGYYTRDDVLEEFKGYSDKESFLSYVGLTEEEYEKCSTYSIMLDMYLYAGFFFDSLNKAESLEEILNFNASNFDEELSDFDELSTEEQDSFRVLVEG